MSYFTIGSEGRTFLAPDAPEWVLDTVRAAHDDELPNDWRWNTVRRIWERLDETEGFLDLDGYDIDALAIEIADHLVALDTSELAGWLAERPARSGYVDPFDIPDPMDIWDLIALAQTNAIREMVLVTITAIKENKS